MLTYREIARIFEEIELRLIRSLKRNLNRHKQEEQTEGFEWSAWQAEKLRNIERFRRENRQIMSEYADVIDSETRELMQEQFAEGAALASSEFGDRSSVSDEHFFGVSNAKMTRLMEDITTLEKTAESAALRTMDDVYRQTLNRVQLAMGTGSVTLESAIDTAVKDFLKQGINCIVYKDGRRVNIADYVRMALRTTSTRAALQGKSASYKKMGYDTVLVSEYGMCSETCLPWQGRVYIDDVFSDWDGVRDGDHGISTYCGKRFPLLSVAMKNGLFHPNCRHTISLWIEGHSKLPEPLDPKQVTERSKAEQTQRALERKVRKCKRQVAGLSDPTAIRLAKQRLRQAQGQLKAHVDEHDFLRREYGREKIYDAAPTAPLQLTKPPTGETIPPQSGTPQSANTKLSEGKSVEVDAPPPEHSYPADSKTYFDEKIPPKSVDKSVESGIINVEEFLESKPKLEQHEIEDCYNTVNPKYGTEQGYSDNCQRCVVAYEARRRGYDVTALPCTDPVNDELTKAFHPNGWANAFSNGTNNLIKIYGADCSSILQNIENCMAAYGNGTRAIIRIEWTDGGGHVFNAEHINNDTVFVDSQFSYLNVEFYFTSEMIKPDTVWLLRVDDKKFNNISAKCFE